MSDESHPLVQLPGSERAPLADATPAGPLDTSERAEVTLVLRRRADLPADIVAGPTVLTTRRAGRAVRGRPRRRGPRPPDAHRPGIGGHCRLSGHPPDQGGGHPGRPVQRVRRHAAAGQQPGPGRPGWSRTATARARCPCRPRWPASCSPCSASTPGRRPGRTSGRAAPPPRRRAPRTAPNQVADIYQFPAGTTGAGQTIAVIELGGGFSTSDLDTYFGGLGIAVPSITAVGVDGASNAPGSDPTGADVEVAWTSTSSAPPRPARRRWCTSRRTTATRASSTRSPTPRRPARRPSPSRSAGASPRTPGPRRDARRWTRRSPTRPRSASPCAWPPATTAAATPSPTARPHVDFPASSPHALGCGGTKLLADPSTGVISSEVVWNETASNEGAGGGGVSDQFALPTWQANAGVPPGRRSRSGPAGLRVGACPTWRATPTRRPAIRSTQAARPRWWAEPARSLRCGRRCWSAGAAEATGQRFGLLQPALYAGVTPGADVPGFHDITSGNNGAYTAGPGWDACTGLGSPDGTALLTRLKG